MSGRLLLIDDDDSHRLLARRALKELKISILEAGTPEDALRTLKIAYPNLELVILDMNLNGVSSISLLFEFRAFAPFEKLPVIVLSTSALEKDVTAAYQAGASCYLVKNIDPREFKNSLERAARYFLGLR